jgi:hypothetical protein
MGILGKVQQNNPQDEFLSEEQMQSMGSQPTMQPKKAGNNVDLMAMLDRLGNSGKMGNQPMGNPENPNGGWEYTNPDDMASRYVPISKTYQPLKYEGPVYEQGTYESPVYEPATAMLFGEQGKSWENSPVFQETGIGKILQERGEHKSVFDSDKETTDMLFGNGEPSVTPTPTMEQPEKPNGWFEDTKAPSVNQPEQPVATPSMAEIMAKVNIPQPTPFTMPLPPQIPINKPIYSTPSIPMPIKRKSFNPAGRPKGSKNKPLPSYNTGLNQGQG